MTTQQSILRTRDGETPPFCFIPWTPDGEIATDEITLEQGEWLQNLDPETWTERERRALIRFRAQINEIPRWVLHALYDLEEKIWGLHFDECGAESWANVVLYRNGVYAIVEGIHSGDLFTLWQLKVGPVEVEVFASGSGERVVVGSGLTVDGR